jgi:hypothetical protein
MPHTSIIAIEPLISTVILTQNKQLGQSVRVEKIYLFLLHDLVALDDALYALFNPALLPQAGSKEQSANSIILPKQEPDAVFDRLARS